MRRLIVLTLTLLLVSCGSPSQAEIDSIVQTALAATAVADKAQECSSAKLTTYADDIERQLSTYDAQRGLVATTARVGLGTPLQRLLDIQTETERMEVPTCAKEFHKSITGAMLLYQQAYQNFSAQGDDGITNGFIAIADESMRNARSGLETLRKGTVPTVVPLSTPTS